MKHILERVYAISLTPLDVDEELTDKSVPGIRFVYGVQVQDETRVIGPAVLNEGIDLRELRYAAVQNLGFTRASLDLSPVRHGFPLFTNHRGHSLAAALLLDDEFWGARVGDLGPLLACATAPSRIFYGPDTKEVREAIATIIRAAPEMEGEDCLMTQILRRTVDGWKLADEAPLN